MLKQTMLKEMILITSVSRCSAVLWIALENKSFWFMMPLSVVPQLVSLELSANSPAASFKKKLNKKKKNSKQQKPDRQLNCSLVSIKSRFVSTLL